MSIQGIKNQTIIELLFHFCFLIMNLVYNLDFFRLCLQGLCPNKLMVGILMLAVQFIQR